MALNFKAAVIDRVIFSRWDKPPSDEDRARMLALMKEHHQRLGRKLIYVASVLAKSTVPTAVERANMNQMMAEGRQFCDAALMLFEGNELQANLQRVIMSTVLIVTRTHSDFLSIPKNADALVEVLTPRLGKDARPLVQEARQGGMLP